MDLIYVFHEKDQWRTPMIMIINRGYECLNTQKYCQFLKHYSTVTSCRSVCEVCLCHH